MSIRAEKKPPSSPWSILSAFSASAFATLQAARDGGGGGTRVIHPHFPYLDKTRGQFSSCVRGQPMTPNRAKQQPK